MACGWELLVANVGDSCAYLDTGSEVLQVSCICQVNCWCSLRAVVAHVGTACAISGTGSEVLQAKVC